MGSLERRLAALEAQLEGLWDAGPVEKERIAREALSMLPTPELRLVVAGLRRVKERYVGVPPDTPIPASVYEELLRQKEQGASARLQELRAELREEGAS